MAIATLHILGPLAPLFRFAVSPFAVSPSRVFQFSALLATRPPKPPPSSGQGRTTEDALAKEEVGDVGNAGVDLLNPQINQARLGL